MRTLLIILIILSHSQWSQAQTIEKFSIDSGGASATVGNIQILYTIGEVNVQELSAGNIQVSEGFINSVKLLIKLNPSVFLQGPYNAGSMFDDLRSTANIPTTSPYVDVLTCNSSVFTVTGTDAIVDWVWIEIRDTDGTTVLTSRSALLQSDGNVVDVDGVSPVNINTLNGSYYVMISHRNHIGVLTANTIAMSGGTTTSLDLTQNIVLITGGANAIADMGDGNLALFSGDFNGDGQVQNSDKNEVELLRGTNGYSNADIDMNSEVQNSDINTSLNPNIGKGVQFSSKKLFAKRSNQKNK